MTPPLPCEQDPAVLGLELDAAWESYQVAARKLFAERAVSNHYRRREKRLAPLLAALDVISSAVAEWQQAPHARPAEHVLHSIQSAITTGRRESEEVAEKQRKVFP